MISGFATLKQTERMELPRRKSSKQFSGARTAAAAALVIFAVIILLGDFIAPYDYTGQSRQSVSAPPSVIRFRDGSGGFGFRPFIYKQKVADPLMHTYEELTEEKHSLEFFIRGDPYLMLGFIPADIHLFGVAGPGVDVPRVHVLGTDQLGRDRLSRLLIAIRFSLLVCPIGAVLASFIGILIGLLSGYAGRFADTVMMGAADTMLALPTLVLILAARAAFPLELPPMRAAVLLIFIFALTGWAGMARLTRGVVRSLKGREFILAARSLGLSEVRVLFRHILPNASPVLVTQFLVMLPDFLLSEVALSYLGIGLQEPQPSLGNMLAAAGDITQLARQPFLLLSPAIAIFIFVLAIRSISRPGRPAHSLLAEK